MSYATRSCGGPVPSSVIGAKGLEAVDFRDRRSSIEHTLSKGGTAMQYMLQIYTGGAMSQWEG
ncbi:MAG TPA: hypothetical protein VNZ01_11375, partial [Solirubrobacteraceae bacterium]|nr:hypothetical protein [Solirubrobacteraceae bacterium]